MNMCIEFKGISSIVMQRQKKKFIHFILKFKRGWMQNTKTFIHSHCFAGSVEVYFTAEITEMISISLGATLMRNIQKSIHPYININISIIDIHIFKNNFSLFTTLTTIHRDIFHRCWKYQLLLEIFFYLFWGKMRNSCIFLYFKTKTFYTRLAAHFNTLVYTFFMG